MKAVLARSAVEAVDDALEVELLRRSRPDNGAHVIAQPDQRSPEVLRCSRLGDDLAARRSSQGRLDERTAVVEVHKYFWNQAAAASTAASNALAVVIVCVAPGTTVTPFGPFRSFDAATACASLFSRASFSARTNRIAVFGGTASTNQKGW